MTNMSSYKSSLYNRIDDITDLERRMLITETKFDYAFEVASLEYDIALNNRRQNIMQYKIELLQESGDYNTLRHTYMEADNQAKAGLVETLKSIIDKIIKFIKDIVKSIKNLATDQDFNPEDFETSGLKGMALNIDIEKKMSEIENRMSTGHKLLRAISQGTGVPEEKLRGYCYAVEGFVKDIPKIAVSAAKTGAVVGGTVLLFKNWKKFTKHANGVLDKMDADMEQAKNNVKGRSQEKEVVGAMGKLVKKYGTIVNRVMMAYRIITK